MDFRLTLTAVAVGLATLLVGCADQPTTLLEPSFARGGPQSTVHVQFLDEPSPQLVPFFGPDRTLDFYNPNGEPTVVVGKVGKSSLSTSPSDFELGVELGEGFFDGKDPYSDPSCETDFLTTFLTEAADGSVFGQIEILADWAPPRGDRIGVNFQWDDVEEGKTYQLRIPAQGYDLQVLSESDLTILAVRDGHFEIRRRDLGHTKTWFEMDRCFNTGNNGFINFELWVSK